MDNEQYTIPGMTGVDVSLPIAGPGSRSYAFIIDWHITSMFFFNQLYICAVFCCQDDFFWNPIFWKLGEPLF